MSEDLEQLCAEFELAADYAEEMRLRAKRCKQPPDPVAWLGQIESLLSEKLPKLPPEVCEEFTSLVTYQLRHARRCLAVGDSDGLAVAVMLLHENRKLIESNIRIGAGVKVVEQRVNAGISSGEQRSEERRTEWDAWQKCAEEIFARNRSLSKSAVCAKVGEKFGVTARAVSARVRWVGRPRKKRN